MRYIYPILLITLAVAAAPDPEPVLPVTVGQAATAVDAPQQPLNFVGKSSNYLWSYPFDKPSPAGLYEVRNAIVDRSHKVGAWSEPATFTALSGWQLYACGRNQPPTSDECGLVWKLKCLNVTETADYTNGSEHYLATTYETYSPSPYSISGPEPRLLFDKWQRFVSIASLPMGGRHQAVATAPFIAVSQLPARTCQVAYCRVTEAGETALSPPVTVEVGAGLNSQTIQAQFTITEPHPQGVLGYHVYVLNEVNEWRRVRNYLADDWLYQWWDMQPLVLGVPEGAPIHQPVAAPQSRLNWLHLQLKNTTGNIVVPAGSSFDCYCPVVDEWRIDGVFYTFLRKIQSADGGKWFLRQQPSYSGHRSWPVLGIYNQYSIWQGVQIVGDGCTAAVATADWSGGQCFGTRFIECSLNGTECGLLVSSRSAGSSLNLGGHTASELSLENCTITGQRVGLSLGGMQTANVRLHRTHLVGGVGRRASAAYISLPNQVRFTGGLYAECSQGQAIFRADTWRCEILADDIWVDGGFRCFAELGHTTANIKLNGGKLNYWRGETEHITMLRCIDQPPAPTRLVCRDVILQTNDYENNPGTLGVLTSQYNLTDLRFEDTALADRVVLREPTLAHARARAALTMPWEPLIQERPLLGYKVVQPPTTMILNGVSMTVPESVTVQNSFTNSPRVARLSWVE